jgi:proteasome component ECM29
MQAKIDQLKLMGPVILSGIMKSLDSYSSSEAGLLKELILFFYLNDISLFHIQFLSIDSDASAREVKTYAFQSIGLLAQRMPHLFRSQSLYFLWSTIFPISKFICLFWNLFALAGP